MANASDLLTESLWKWFRLNKRDTDDHTKMQERDEVGRKNK